LICGDEFYVAALDQVRSDFEQYGFEISENTQTSRFDSASACAMWNACWTGKAPPL
jgi:hypothetical protein